MNQHLKLAYDHGVQRALQEAGITKTAETPDWMRAGPLVGALGGLAMLHPRLRRGAKDLIQTGVEKLRPTTGLSYDKLRESVPMALKGLGVVGAGTTIGWLPQLTYEGLEAGLT